MFSLGCTVMMQLHCCLGNQGELPELCLQNLLDTLTPFPVDCASVCDSPAHRTLCTFNVRVPAAGHSVPVSKSVKTDYPLVLKANHGWQSVCGVRGGPRDGHVLRAQVGQGGVQGRHGQQDR